MGTEDIELAEIEFLREVMLAEYHATRLLWNAVQAAALAVLGVAGISWLRGDLQTLPATAVAVVSLAVLTIANLALKRADAFFAREALRLLKRFKRLKEEGHP